MNKIIFLDLETTGLDANTDSILEVGLVITNGDLNEICTYSNVVGHSEETLAKMNGWCWKTHTESGLVKSVRASFEDLQEIEQSIIEIIDEEFGADKPILAGSSIHFDRSFIKKHMPYLDRRLHYRMIDTSSFKEAYRLMFGHERPSYGYVCAHRVIDDCRASISELKYYTGYVDKRSMQLEKLFSDLE